MQLHFMYINNYLVILLGRGILKGKFSFQTIPKELNMLNEHRILPPAHLGGQLKNRGRQGEGNE